MISNQFVFFYFNTKPTVGTGLSFVGDGFESFSYVFSREKRPFGSKPQGHFDSPNVEMGAVSTNGTVIPHAMSQKNKYTSSKFMGLFVNVKSICVQEEEHE